MSQWFLIYLQIFAPITTVSFNTFSLPPKKKKKRKERKKGKEKKILSSRSAISPPSPSLSPNQRPRIYP
jgi:hypothetical protein